MLFLLFAMLLFIWTLSVTRAATIDLANERFTAELGASLRWVPGVGAVSHDVYFGTDMNAVANATTASAEFMGNQTETTYDPNTLAEDTYFWRVDEKDGSTTWSGNVWRFTVADDVNPITHQVLPITTDTDDVANRNFGWYEGLTHVEEPGENRLLIFLAFVEDDNTDMDLTSVTYGGQAMTKILDRNVTSASDKPYVAAYMLDESGIQAASGSTFVPTWAAASSNPPSYVSVFLNNVDQSDPIGNTDGAASDSVATVTGGSLATSAGDLAIVAGCSSVAGSYLLDNNFRECIELEPASADGVAGFREGFGYPVTPQITHDVSSNQAMISFVVNVVYDIGF